MNAEVRKTVHRSPNYPIKPLDWAVQTALGLLEKEGKHAVPADIVAQNLGYKDANNGKVRRVLANLKAFGVLDKAPGGKLAVNPDVSRYKLIPTQDGKQAILGQWLRKPTIFSTLIDKYDHDLPSDNVLLFELVEDHGFSEQAAGNAIQVFKDSLEFASFNDPEAEEVLDQEDVKKEISISSTTVESASPEESTQTREVSKANVDTLETSTVRYPIRLAGGRMAWIDVPEPFYEADKRKLRAQIEIIGTEDEDYDFEEN